MLSPDGRPFCAKHVNKAKSSKPKAVGSAGGEAADVAAAAEIGRAKAAQQAAEAATGGDGFTIDIKTGEKVYVEYAQPGSEPAGTEPAATASHAFCETHPAPTRHIPIPLVTSRSHSSHPAPTRHIRIPRVTSRPHNRRAATKRKYRLGPEGKLYEDEKVKKSYGGATGFNLGGKTSWNDAGRAG